MTDEPSNLQQILPLIKKETEDLAEWICKRHGYNTPYQIVFKKLEGEHENDKIVITPGNPPVIIIHHNFLIWCLAFQKNIIFRHNLESALEHMHVMHRTLKHPISLKYAKALREENKKWIKTIIPQVINRIAEKHLEVTYSVQVKDKISKMSIELHGNDPKEIRDQAVLRLSRQVFEHEDMEELHDQLMDIQRAKSAKTLPNKIVISGNVEQIQTKMEY